MSKFSIILPVRNGGEYVKDCVSSILSQSYTSFNLVVLDNKSTDGTLEWLQSLSDERIVIYPSEKSLTIEENWGRIVSTPKNEFITLIGHDDILYKDYLQSMNELIDQYPDASLYQTHFTYIDSKGAKIRTCIPMSAIEKAEGFLENFLQNNIDIMGTGFMMRAKDYESLGGIPPYPNLLFADFELWINLTKKGFKATSPNECFSFRLHQSTTTVSPDIKFQRAFQQFIYFLKSLSIERETFKAIISKDAARFLNFYCQGLSHRLLRTKMKDREGLTIKMFIHNCKEYAEMLGVQQSFRPEKNKSLSVAKIIDSTPFTRFIFRMFKKIYPAPVMK